MRHSLAISSQCSPIDSPVRGSATVGACGLRSRGRNDSHGASRCPKVLPRALASAIREKPRLATIGTSLTVSTPPAIAHSISPRAMRCASCTVVVRLVPQARCMS
jgi:hypothetical protein